MKMTKMTKPRGWGKTIRVRSLRSGRRGRGDVTLLGLDDDASPTPVPRPVGSGRRRGWARAACASCAALCVDVPPV
jgi:hypothetical protein